MMHEDGTSLPLDILQLWAKGRPRKPGDSYHPLLCHLIDVGSVAEAIWDIVLPSQRRKWFADGLGIPETVARAWFVFAGAAHDLGKASPVFQYRERFSDTHVPHGTIGAFLLLSHLAEFGMERRIALDLACLIGGHHGRTPQPKEIGNLELRFPSQLADTSDLDWDRHRHVLITQAVAALGIELEHLPVSLPLPQGVWWHGALTPIDWIGSHESYFPFVAPAGVAPADWDLSDYVDRARVHGQLALKDLGWTARPRDRGAKSFTELFPMTSNGLPLIPNDLQRTVEEIAAGIEKPTILIIEAPMGDGKTESALFVAERNVSCLGMTGHTLLLPTQATSNQMLERDDVYLSNWYSDDLVALQLAHGKSAFSDRMESLQHRDGETGVVAFSWFAGRKQALLASFGVGTVDQALMGVLTVTHGFVRLFGLAGKTVVIDEVHAYDAYMTTLLERAIEWLAALGSPVVLLSATLPAEKSAALIAAYARGRDLTRTPGIAGIGSLAPYPRTTWLAGDDIRSVPVEASERSRKDVRLRWVAGDAKHHATHLGPMLRELLAGGGCAAVVCNTVRQAQAVYRSLKDQNVVCPPDELGLLHARFPQQDRVLREERFVRMFGPGSEHRPHRFVLVATQVIEQSLDLDFDLLVTELAPADFVLQRSGRLHRHSRAHRPARLATPNLWILGPNEVDGIPQFSQGWAGVYEPHVLLRSWLLLRDRAEIRIPGDVEDLIEALYSDGMDLLPADADSELATLWQQTLERLVEAVENDRRLGKLSRIKPPWSTGRLYDVSAGNESDEEHHVATRLTPPTMEIICLEGDGSGQALDPRDSAVLPAGHRPDRDLTRALMGRSVRVQGQRVHELREHLATPSGWNHNGHLRYQRQAVFQNGRCRAGRLTLVLDAELGLDFEGS